MYIYIYIERERDSKLTTKSWGSQVWLALLGFLYRQGDLEGGRKTLPRCIIYIYIYILFMVYIYICLFAYLFI